MIDDAAAGETARESRGTKHTDLEHNKRVVVGGLVKLIAQRGWLLGFDVFAELRYELEDLRYGFMSDIMMTSE